MTLTIALRLDKYWCSAFSRLTEVESSKKFTISTLSSFFFLFKLRIEKREMGRWLQCGESNLNNKWKSKKPTNWVTKIPHDLNSSMRYRCIFISIIQFTREAKRWIKGHIFTGIYNGQESQSYIPKVALELKVLYRCNWKQ